MNHFRRHFVPALVTLAAGVVAIGLARRFERLEVVGESMRPALEAGDRLLVLRGARPRPGDLVAVVDPRLPERTIVKRLVNPDLGGGFIVLGDNPGASTDSRHFGPVPRNVIRGRVVYRYAPEARRGALRRQKVRSQEE